MYLVVGFLFVAVVRSSFGESREFDFKDPKGVNTMYFVLESTVEPIMGLASGVGGKVKFDPAKPEATSGSITVEAKSIDFPNKGMTNKLQESEWLDVKKHPTIDFKIKEIKDVKKGAESTIEMQVTGDFTCRGVTKEMTVPVKASYLQDKLGNRLQGKSGDLLVLRTSFKIKRADFGIKPSMGGEVVAEEIEIRASIVGQSPKA